MLPDFPVPKSKAKQLIQEFFGKRLKLHLGFFAEIPKVPIHEGARWKFIRPDGTADESNMEPVKSRLEVSADEPKEPSAATILRYFDELAKNMAVQMSRRVFERVDQVTQESGQQYTLGGSDMSLEDFDRILEGMQLDFDDDGKPILPSLVTSPAFFEKLQGRAESLNAEAATPERQERREELIRKKKEEFRDRENRRRLVD